MKKRFPCCWFFLVMAAIHPSFGQIQTSAAADSHQPAPDLSFGDSAEGLLPQVTNSQEISVSLEVFNRGNAASTTGELAVFLSNDVVITSGIRLQTAVVPILGEGQSHPLALELRIPEKALGGSRFLVFALDPEERIAESNEGNNFFVHEVEVQQSDRSLQLSSQTVVLDFSELSQGQTIWDRYGHLGIEFQASEWKGRDEGVVDALPIAAAPVAETSLSTFPALSWINVPRGIVGDETRHTFSHNNIIGNKVFSQAFAGLEGSGVAASGRGESQFGGSIGEWWTVFYLPMLVQARSLAVWHEFLLPEPFYIDQLTMEIIIPPPNAFVLDLDAPFGDFEVPEGDNRSFGVRLQEELVNGEWLEIEVVRIAHTSGGEVLNIIPNTHTFTANNWNQMHSFVVRATDNNFNHTNGKATFEIRKKRGVYGNEIAPYSVNVEELDNEFLLTIQPKQPEGGGPVGGSTSPEFIEEPRSLTATGGWRMDITATPDPGYQVADWEISFNGDTASDGQDRYGDIVLSDPQPVGNGAVKRRIEDITLDPDGESSFAVRPVFLDVPLVSVTFVVGAGEGSTEPNGSENLPQGETLEIEATPATGFRFGRWHVLSGSATIGDVGGFQTTLTPHTDCVIEVHFDSLGGWDISPNSITVPEGELRYVQIGLSEVQDTDITFSVVRASGTQPEPVVNGSPNFVISAGSTEPVLVPIFAPENDGTIAIGSAFFEVVPTSGPPDFPLGGFSAISGEDDIRLDLSVLNASHGSTHPAAPVILDTAGSNTDLPYTITATPNQGLIFFGWTIQNDITSLDLSPPDIDTNGTATSEIRATSGDIVMVAEFVPDELQFVATQNPVLVTEGDQQTVSITLTKPPQPAGQGRTVVAKVTASTGDGDLTIDNEAQTFTFTDSNWNDPSAWVKTFSANQDGDTTDGQRSFLVEQVGGTSVDLVPDLAINAVEVEDDFVEGTVVVTPPSLTIEAGDRRSFFVSLSQRPSGIVELRPSRLNDIEHLILIFDESDQRPPLRFDQNNWNIPQEVVIVVWQLADDILDPGETYSVNCRFGQVGGDGGSFDPVVRQVHAIRSDGLAELLVEPELRTLEVGQTHTVGVRLTDPPETAQLGIRVQYEGEGEAEMTGPASLSFTADNYQILQFVPLRGLEPGSGRLQFSWESGSPQFSTRFADIIVIGDAPSLLADPNSLELSAGAEASFNLTLTEAPETDVVVSLTTQGVANLTLVAPTSGQLIFSPETFSEPQTVVIRGSSEGTGTVQVSQLAGSPTIEGLDVPVTVSGASDFDVLATPTSLELQANQTRSLQVRLSSAPEADVVLSLSASDTSGNPGVRVISPANGQLLFTTENATQSQTVTVTASASGTGQVVLASQSGPFVNGVVVPVIVDSATCSGTLSVTPFATTLNEGSPGTIQLTQTNLYHLPRVFEITSTYPGASSFSVPETVTIASGQTVSIPISALEEDNSGDEAARFVISQVENASPPCSFSDRFFDLYTVDDDYHLTLTTAGDNGSSTTIPAAGTAVSVDSTTYGNGYPIVAQAGPGYQFSHWSGDISYLSGSANPVQDQAPHLVVNGPDPAVTQVALTAHFVEIEPEVKEEVDAIVDALLDELTAQCGLGAADFSERDLESGNRTGAMDGGRILPHSGQELRDEVDLTLPGLDHPTQIRITRRHLTRRNADRSPFGPAWFFNYRIYFTRDDVGNILLHNLGRTDLFAPDPAATETWTGTGGRFGRMVRETASRVVLRAPSGVIWQFRAIRDPQDPLFKGILERIISPNGNQIQFHYQTDGASLLNQKMNKIVDAYGREVHLIYGSDGTGPYVTEVHDYTDPAAPRIWHYTYDGEGKLTGVRSPAVTSTSGLNDFPDGKLTSYQYYGHSDPRLKYALKAIVAPNQNRAGQSYPRYQWTYYDENPSHGLFGYVKSHTVGAPDAPYPLRSGGTFTYSYQPMVSDGGMGQVSMCTTVTDRAGMTTELDYNRRGHLLEERIENPQAGSNKNSPSHFKRSFTYNAHGDVTSSKTPIQTGQGASDYREEHPDPDQTPRHMLRQERRKIQNADHRGGDQTKIVMETRYEPIFNKVFSSVDPRGLGDAPEHAPEDVTTYQYYDYMEDLSAAIEYFAPQLGLTVSELTFHMLQAGIPQRIQSQWGIQPLSGDTVDINEDGRSALDPCGNLIRRDFPDTTLPAEAVELGLNRNQVAFERFIYNRYGQMVQRVDAEQNVTSRFFFPASDPSGWNGSQPSSAYADGGGFLARTIDNHGPADPQSNSGSGAPAIGRTTNYAYGAEGSFPRNARGIATLVTDSRGVITRHLVNELDQLVIHQSAWQVPEGDPDLAILRYQRRNYYDANDNVRQTGVRNSGSLNGGPNFFYDRRVFDILDQPVRKIMDSAGDGLNLTAEMEYDANQNLVKKTDGVGTPDVSVTEWEYDARDLLVSVTRGAGGDPQIGEIATFTYEYDDNGNRLREIDADGDVTQFHFDGFDRLFETVDRVGNTQKSHYDAASNIIGVELRGPVETDGPTILLSKTETLYDQRGRAYETLKHLFHYPGRGYGLLDPGANGTLQNSSLGLVRMEVVFDRNNRPIGKINAHGDLFRTEYNGLGGIYRTLDPLGNTVLYEYDANHNLVVVTEGEVDPQGVLDSETFVTRYRFDALNRVFSVVEPNGQETLTYYDSRNNVVRIKNPLNNTTDYHYDALNRKIEEIRYLSESERDAGPNSFSETINLKTEWDALNRLAARIDDLGNRTEYRYDDLNRRIKRVQPGGETETWIYNGDGEMMTATNQAGSVASWQYDAAGRPLQMNIDHGAITSDFSFAGTEFKRWEYDGLNRQTLTYDDNGKRANPGSDREVGCVYVYDSLSRPILEIQTLGQAELKDPFHLGKKIVMEWQGIQRLVSQTYTDGRKINRTYDSLNRLTGVREANGAAIAEFRYMGPHRDLTVRYANGTVLDKKDPVSPTTIGFGYDGNRRSLNHRWLRQSDGAVITGYRDTYNGDAGVGTNRVKAQYRDHLNRGDQWTFDSRHRIVDFLRNDQRNLATHRVFDGTDAMVEFVDENTHKTPLPNWRWLDYAYFDGLPRSHDENGNLRNDIQLDFTYDYDNRLVAVRDFSTAQVLAEYLYTADNKRVYKTVAGEGTRYLYQGWQVLEERNAADQTLRQFVAGRALDEHLQLLDVAGTGGAYYYHGNAQGFVGALSDENGQVVEYAEYSMLGRPVLLDGATLTPYPEPVSSVGNPYLFQGLHYDPETKFYYFRNRYYDPKTGHFNTLDPMGRWHHGQGNGFSAFDADPWNNRDPMGLQTNSREPQWYDGLLGGGPAGDMTIRFWEAVGRNLREGATSLWQTVRHPIQTNRAIRAGLLAYRDNIHARSLFDGSGDPRLLVYLDILMEDLWNHIVHSDPYDLTAEAFLGGLPTGATCAKILDKLNMRAGDLDELFLHEIRASQTGRSIYLGSLPDVGAWRLTPGATVIDIPNNISEKVYGPWSMDLNEEILLDSIINGDGIYFVTRPGVDSFYNFESPRYPRRVFSAEEDLLRLLGLLGGSL